MVATLLGYVGGGYGTSYGGGDGRGLCRHNGCDVLVVCIGSFEMVVLLMRGDDGGDSSQGGIGGGEP